MDEKNSSQVQPIVAQGEGWKPKQQRKRTFVGPKDELRKEEEKFTRHPVPLPFGKIDVFA